MQPIGVAESMFFFVLAGLCEIGGGYLVWLWLREGKSAWIGVLGVLFCFFTESFLH